MKRLGIRIEALDTLFFRDGRPFVAASRAESGLPSPQTLTGALRTGLLKKAGCDFDLLGQAIRDQASFAEALADQELAELADLSVRGPWLADCRDHQMIQPYLPVPTALRQLKQGNELKRLSPMRHAMPGWSQSDQLLPLWLPERVNLESAAGFLRLKDMQTFLKGDVPSAQALIPESQVFSFEERTGIGVAYDQQSAEEGRIYGLQLLRLHPGFGFYAEVDLPEAYLSAVEGQTWLLPFGGEGRRASFQFGAPLEWPVAPQATAQQAIVRVLTSPAIVDDPVFIKSWGLQAAALAPWQGISGWDLASRGPKPLRWVLPAGSTLFFDPQQLPPPAFCSDSDAQSGWGTYLEGVSNYV